MRRDIFELLNTGETYFDNIFRTHNIAQYGSKIWCVYVYTAGAGNFILETYSRADIGTAPDTEEDAHTFTPISNPVALQDVNNHGIYADGTYIISYMAVGGLNDDTSQYELYLLVRYSTDDGSTWNSLTYEMESDGNTSFTSKAINCFKIGSNYYIHITHENDAGVHTNEFYRILPTQASITTQTIDNFIYVYPGNVYTEDSSTKYYYIAATGGSGVYSIFSFNGTTITSVETLTGLVLSASANVAIYWRYKNIELIIDNKYFYVRIGRTNDWSSYTDTGTNTNGYVWERDNGGEKRPRWIIWKDTIYRIFPNGGQQVFQDDFTENAYAGWEDWFSALSGEIYQATSNQEESTECIVNGTLEMGLNNVFNTYPPITEKGINIKDFSGNIIAWITLDTITSVGKTGQQTGQSVHNIDLRRSISTPAVNMAPHTFITTYLEPYWEFMSVGTLDATEGAVDIPAFNQNSSMALRWLNQRFSKVHYPIYEDLTLNWDDGDTDSGKDAIQGTEKLGVFREETKNNPIKNVRVLGGMDSTGTEIIGFASDDVGSFEIRAWHPEINSASYGSDAAAQTAADALAAEILTANNNEQMMYRGDIYRNGFYQIGQQIDFAYSAGDISVSSAKYFVVESSYNTVRRKCTVLLSKYLILPFHNANLVNDNRQHISNVVVDIQTNVSDISDIDSKTSWTWRDTSTTDFDETDLATIGDDTSLHELDLSSIVGAAAKLVRLRCFFLDNAASSTIWFLNGGASNLGTSESQNTQVANVYNQINPFVQTDSNGKIKYAVSPKPTSWTSIDILIRGYRDA